MTDKKTEALKLAMEALENLPEMCGIEEAITAIREALMSVPEGAQSRSDEEQPAQQQSAERVEPVEYWTVADGWVSEQAEVPAAVWVESDFWEHCNRVNCGTAYRLPAPGRQPLYKSPPASKPWVALTDEQQEPVACKTLCELCVKRGYHFCANAAQTTPIPSPPASKPPTASRRKT